MHVWFRFGDSVLELDFQRRFDLRRSDYDTRGHADDPCGRSADR
jgi:hypothetical protein